MPSRPPACAGLLLVMGCLPVIVMPAVTVLPGPGEILHSGAARG